MTVKIAVLGAGVFSRDTYLPLLKRLGDDVEVVALWSRSFEAAKKTLAASPYAEDKHVASKYGEEGLQEILDDSSIDAAINILPVHVSLQVTEKCWRAGKHVLQEKPIAKSTEEAKSVLEAYRSSSHSLWQFAENYRFEEIFLKAKSVKEQIGSVLKMDLTVDVAMNAGNKYFSSTWRRDRNDCPGGFMLEGAVHFIAGLRMVAKDFGYGEVEVVSGQAANLVPEKLPPMDTATAWLLFSTGLCASFSVTYAAQQGKFHLCVVGTDGTLDIRRLSPAGYVLTVTKSNNVVETIKETQFSGVENEVIQFLSSVKLAKKGEADTSDGAKRAQPEEGLRDLAVVEALLRSSETGGQPTAVATSSDP